MAGGEAVWEGVSLASIPQQSRPAPQGFDGMDLEPSVERARLIRCQRAADGSAASERAGILALAAELRRRARAWRHVRAHSLLCCSRYAPNCALHPARIMTAGAH